MTMNRRSSTTHHVALCTLAVLLATPTVAAADPVEETAAARAQSGSVPLGGWRIFGDLAGVATADLDVEAHATWSASFSTSVGWESEDVRQGTDLDVSRRATASGSITVSWTVSGTLDAPIVGTIDIGEVPLSANNVACAPRLEGDDYDCVAESSRMEILGLPPGFCDFPAPGIPLHPYVELGLRVRFTITPDGVVTQRTLVVDEDEMGSEELTITTTPMEETLSLPCTSPAGSEVGYALRELSWTPGTSASQRPFIAVGLMDPIVGCEKIEAYSGNLGDPVVTSPRFELTGDGLTMEMGELLDNDVPPTIAAMGAFDGVEGSPVTFGASVDSQCPIGTYIWRFSDDGTAFGAAPQHTFEDDALYSGELTVIDITGLDAVANFSADISNAAPTAVAGPDTSDVWGVPIAFNGQGVDPGAVDNDTLVYSWDWGDGTPGTGGANAFHAYDAPGRYVATLTVCDDHVCVDDSANVTVERRATRVAYTGANIGVYSGDAQLAGTVIDERGEPVGGATLSFALGGSPEGSAQSNGSGTATRTFTVTPDAGVYPVSASYAGSALYAGNSATESFEVVQMATVLEYTGPIHSKQNKTIALSAELLDVLGRPLAGKVVVFDLGTRSATATTDEAGLASTTIELDQKKGVFTLTTSYTPSAADEGRWFGTADSDTFRLQVK